MLACLPDNALLARRCPRVRVLCNNSPPSCLPGLTLATWHGQVQRMAQHNAPRSLLQAAAPAGGRAS